MRHLRVLAVSRATTATKGAFGHIVLRGILQQLHGLLQVGQDVGNNGLFCYKHDGLHQQQQGPSQGPEPVGGPQSRDVLTDFLPVLIGEKTPAEEEKETWGKEEEETVLILGRGEL